MKSFFVIFLLTLMLFPLITLADGEYKISGANVCYQGLVPCGKAIFVGGTLNAQGKCVGGAPVVVNCQLCHFFILLKSIIDFILTIVFITALLFLVAGGLIFIFAGANPQNIERGKKILTSTLIGLGIVLGSWLIVNTILTLPGLMNPALSWDPTQWFQVDCEVTF